MSGWLERLGLALSQAPLAIGWWFSWKQVPVRGLVISLLYELVLFGFIIVRRVWGALIDDVVKWLADSVREVVRVKASGFEKRLRRQIISDNDILNVRATGLINPLPLKLRDIFVELRIATCKNPQELHKSIIGTDSFGAKRSIWNVLESLENASEDATGVVIIGPPGCGKTTLLRYLALAFAANNQIPRGIKPYLPLFLSLRDHVSRLSRENPPSLSELAESFFNDKGSFPSLQPPPNWFKVQLENGRGLILLDGLDEVGELRLRKLVSTWVDSQIKGYPRCRFLLTSRPAGYEETPIQRASILEVQPFDGGQGRQFIHHWYLANEIADSNGEISKTVRTSAQLKASDLVNRVYSSPELISLTVSPLLLTMVAMVHRYRPALPHSRTDLYQQICEVLVGHLQHPVCEGDLTVAQKISLLRSLASHMMDLKVRDIGTPEALSVIAHVLEGFGLPMSVARSIIDDLARCGGLFVEREPDCWSFGHSSFQEYLTAAYWTEHTVNTPEWEMIVRESWWHEALRFFAAQGDATRIVKACLRVSDVNSLTLAAQCMSESRELDSEARETLSNLLVDNLEASDASLRHLAFEVHLSLRLRSFRRLDRHHEIDPQYLSCAEYQLFLDDTRARHMFYQPDHWPDFAFPTGQARSPVTGVRAQDVVAFCQWLSEREGDHATYRLPTLNEVKQDTPEPSELGIWCTQDSEFSLWNLSDPRKRQINDTLQQLSTLPLPTSLGIGIDAASMRCVLDRQCETDRSLVRAFEYALDISRALNADRPPDLTRPITIERARAVSKRLEIARDDLNEIIQHYNSSVVAKLEQALEYVLAVTRALDYDVVLDSDRDALTYLVRDQSRDAGLDRKVGLVRAWERGLVFASEIVTNLFFCCLHVRDFVYASERIRDLYITRDLGIDIATEVAKSKNLHDIVAALESNDFAETERLIRSSRSDPDIRTARFAILLKSLMSVPKTQLVLIGRRVQRAYLSSLLESSYKSGYGEREGSSFEWDPNSGEVRAETSHRAVLLEMYWWLRIMIAREAKQQLAWEGIRIVREYVSIER
jgi:energy-coupling factor transporter ATP-binding protein EcfA2